MPRYSRGTDDAARHAPPIERRDAPTISRSAPVPNASQFSASATEGVGSYEASAYIATVDGSILRTSRCRPASHLLARLEEKIVANASAIPSRDPLPEEGIGLATCPSDGQRAASTVTRAAT